MSSGHQPSTEAPSGGVTESLERCVERLTAELRGHSSLLQKELEGQDIPTFAVPESLTQAYADAQAVQAAAPELGRKRKTADDYAQKVWFKGPGQSKVDPNITPFLAYTEEFFRHITAKDLGGLLPGPEDAPLTLPGEKDPDFLVPALGRHYSLGGWSLSHRRPPNKSLSSPGRNASHVAPTDLFLRRERAPVQMG